MSERSEFFFSGGKVSPPRPNPAQTPPKHHTKTSGLSNPSDRLRIIVIEILELDAIPPAATNVAGLDIVHPAVNLDLSGSQLGRHHRVRAQVLNLLQHIFLNGFVQVFRIQRRVTVNAMAFTNDFHGGTAMAQPFLYVDRKSTRLNSSHVRISYAVFCL